MSASDILRLERMQLFAKKRRGLGVSFEGAHLSSGCGFIRKALAGAGLFACARTLSPGELSVAGESLCQDCCGCILKACMDTKLLAWVLVLLLSGADSGAVLICAASCISSAPVAGTAVHQHEMESQPTATYKSQHAHRHGAPCVECPGEAGNSLKQKSDCDRLSEIQALKESAFSLDRPIGTADVLFKRTPADSLALGSDCQQSFLFADSATSRRPPPLLPLRI